MRGLLMIFLLVIFDMNSCSQQCDLFVASFLKTYYIEGLDPALALLPPQSIMYSGRSLNDLGYYDSCVESNLNYVTVQIITPVQVLLFIGICLPKQCIASDLITHSKEISFIINQYIDLPIKVIKELKFIDPNLVYPEFDFVAGLVSTVLGLIILLTLIGTFLTLPESKNIEAGTFIEIESQPKRNPPIYLQVLKCFSAHENFKKLIQIKQADPQEDNFRIFNAIRVFSISWVIYCHTFVVMSLGIENLFSFGFIVDDRGWLTICIGGYYAVDVFFFIGGFLGCVLMEDKFRKIRSLKPSIILFSYIHRFIRLWPTYMICLFAYWKISVYMGSGPMWSEYIAQTNYCNQQWWENFLLVDNLFPHELNYCFGWGWYMSNDIQIFLFAPPIMFIYIKNKSAGQLLTWVCLTICLLTSFIICQIKKYHLNYPTMNALPQNDYMEVYYYKPWIRAAPYFMGFLLGFLYIAWKQQEEGIIKKIGIKIQQSALLRIFVYLVGLVCVNFPIWIIMPLQSDMDAWNQQEQTLYQTFGRIMFLSGLGILLIPALLKVPNDPISILLSADVFVPLARVSFSVYLVHFIVILQFYFRQKQMFYLQPGAVVYSAVSYLIFSFIAGTIFSVMIEAPLLNLEKIKGVGKKERKADTEKDTATNSEMKSLSFKDNE